MTAAVLSGYFAVVVGAGAVDDASSLARVPVNTENLERCAVLVEFFREKSENLTLEGGFQEKLRFRSRLAPVAGSQKA